MMDKIYIYLIESLETGQFKIGKTKNVKRRLKTLQTGNGGKLKIIEIFQTKYPNKLESYLHNYFSHEKTIGEWFTFSHGDIKTFKTLCEKMEKIYDELEKIKTIDF